MQPGRRPRQTHGIRLLAAGLSAAWLAGAESAWAQIAAPIPVPDLTRPVLLPEQQPVAARPNPDLDPLPLLFHSFEILPSLQIGEQFDSNIFGSTTHPLSDFITFARPGVAITSDWGGGDKIAFYGQGEVKQFASHTSDNVGNFVLEADGRLDILTGEYLELRTGYQVQHEARFAADSEEAVALAAGGTFARYPTEYDVGLGTLSFVRSRGQLGLAVDAGIQAYSFSNEPTLNGGLALNSDRNRNVYTLTPRLSYEVEPGIQAFAQASGARTQYDLTFDSTPEHYRRSSYGYAAAAGSQFDIADTFTGEVYLGYAGQQYDDARLESVEGPYFGGNVLWNVTPNTSLTLKTARTIEETILIGSPGAFMTQVEMGIQQEVSSDLLVTGDTSYTATDYQVIGRNDELYGAAAGTDWKLSRYYLLSARGSWARRISNFAGASLNDETVSLSLKVTL